MIKKVQKHFFCLNSSCQKWLFLETRPSSLWSQDTHEMFIMDDSLSWHAKNVKFKYACPNVKACCIPPHLGLFVCFRKAMNRLFYFPYKTWPLRLPFVHLFTFLKHINLYFWDIIFRSCDVHVLHSLRYVEVVCALFNYMHMGHIEIYIKI